MADQVKPGPVPVGRPTKIQLSFEFDMQKQAEGQKRSFQYFLNEAYPPCAKDLSELKSISLAELKLEERHHGRVLFVRTTEEPAHVASIQTLVQDGQGTADRLAIYNMDSTVNAEEYLPEDAVIAIKEPLYTTIETGHNTLRVDHPSEVIRLTPLDPRVPPELVEELKPTRKTALEWKAEGNAAYIKDKYFSAVYAYDAGVHACGAEDELVKRDILRNRSIVNLFLQRYEQATADGEAAVIPASLQDDAKAKDLNVKAYDRAGRAAYELRMLDRAKKMFHNVQNLAPENKDASTMLARIEERLKEQHGGYDFEKMSKSCSKRHNRLEHADFTSNTVIRDTKTRGRGLFATKAIPAGGLVVVEKALSVAFESDPLPRSCTILDPKTKRAATGTQTNLLFNLVQKLSHNEQLAQKFNGLFDGKTRSSSSTSAVDGTVPIDTFRTLGIIDHNAFGCPTVRSSSRSAQTEAASQAGFHSTGLWVHIAYINHACDGNAMRSFIGDMMIVRATRDIAEGEEILHPYRIPDAVNAVTQQELERTFGFRCDCAICVAEAATPVVQQRKRKLLIEKVRSFVAANPVAPQKKPSAAKISQMERLAQELSATYGYDEKAFAGLPRLGMVAPYLWLCQAYKAAGNRDMVIQSAKLLLLNLGFDVTGLKGQKAAVERKHCQLDGTAIDAAMYSSLAWKSKGNKQEAGLMEEFAKELYLIMNGELRGFEERYQET